MPPAGPADDITTPVDIEKGRLVRGGGEGRGTSGEY